MKYTITLTAEDLAFVEVLRDEDIACLMKTLHKKLSGREINDDVVDVFIEEKDWKKLKNLAKPLKTQSEGTITVTTAVCKLLNERLELEGRKGHKSTTLSTKKLISARLREGYELEDFIEVVDKKVAEWKDTEQEKYLRPETLFGNKFAGYLAQKDSVGPTQTTEQQRSNNYSEGLM